MSVDYFFRLVGTWCRCPNCGDEWSRKPSNDIIVQCPSCHRHSAMTAVSVGMDCDGDQDPSPELEAERRKLAELVEKVALFCNPSTAARRIPWNWTSPSEVFRAVNIDELIDELEEVQNLIDQASTQGRTVDGVPFGC